MARPPSLRERLCQPERLLAGLVSAWEGPPLLLAGVPSALPQGRGGRGPYAASTRGGPGSGGGPDPGGDPDTGGDSGPGGEGEWIGAFRLGRQIGHGGMGVVYEAHHTLLKGPKAIKVLSPHLHTNSQAKERFLTEASTLSALDHPNVCRIYDAGETQDGRVYLAMARYDGATLAERIAEGPLSVDEAADFALQTACGLCAAHRQGIVHRDLKPDNVFVTSDGVVKILDFGIAKVAGSLHTQTGYALGTAAYASPEQMRGAGDHRADLWALGVVLYEMLAGARPFEAEYDAALLYAIAHDTPVPIQERRPDVPPGLAAVVERCLQKDPAARYARTEDLVEELEALTQPNRIPPRPIPLWGWIPVGLGVSAALLAVVLWMGAERYAGDGVFTPDVGVRHLAVLPLDDFGEDPEFARGLTAALAGALTQLGPYAEDSLRVVPATETQGLTDTRQAREQFGAREAVTGEVQLTGGRIRVALTLRETRRDRPLRTQTLDLPASQAALLQEGLVEAAATLLGVPLSRAVRLALTAGGTADPEAYEFYTKGRGALARYDQLEQVATAEQMFEWALQEDATYALAHAGLCETNLYRYQFQAEPERVGIAEAHCQRALALDERLAPVHATLGRLLVERGRYDEAIQAFHLALALDSLHAGAYDGLGQALQLASRPREAEAAYRRALQLAPRSWSYHNHLGMFYLRTGRFEEAARQFEAIVRAVPDHAWGHSNLGAAYLYRGQLAEAKAALEQANAFQPTAFAYTNLGVIAYYLGTPQEEIQMYERALGIQPADYVVWGNLAGAYRRAGEHEKAREAYRRAADLVDARLAVNPQHAERLVDLAGYALNLGERERARAAIERAIRLAPGNVLLQGQAAVVYAGLGEREAALTAARRALDGGYPRADLDADTTLAELLREAFSP